MNRFTDEQIREYNDAFCMFDTQNLGFILSTDLRDMLKTIGFNPTDQLLENLSIVIDSDGNGKIDFQEFIDLIDRLETENKNDKEAREAFNAFDFKGLGYVTAYDVKEALSYIMQKSSEAEKTSVYTHFKLQDNRKIYFEEFKEMITIRR